MVYKLDIVHKKYYYNKRIELVSYELIETDDTACYDYDRGTRWIKEGNDRTSTYRMAAYFKNIESVIKRNIAEKMELITFKRGTKIISTDDPNPNTVYLLKKGTLNFYI